MTRLADRSHENPLSEIRARLKAEGFDKALQAIRSLPAEYNSAVQSALRLLACDLVEPALQYNKDPRLPRMLATARAYARGEATEEELNQAVLRAHSAERDAWTESEKLVARAVQDATSKWLYVLSAANNAARAAAESCNGNDRPSWQAARAEQEGILSKWLEGK